MESRRPWLAAARPVEALLAPLGVAVGSSYAHFDARSGPGLPAHVVVLSAAVAAGIGVNLVDHAWDRLGAPPPDPKAPVPEWSRPIEARDAAIAGAATILFAALCGFGLVPLSGSAALGYGALAVLLGVARGAPVAGLDTLGFGLGDIANLLALGPLAVTAGFASQAGTGSWGACLAGLPVGLVATAALFSRHFTRRDVDAALARVTPVVALGEEQARQALVALPLLAAAAVTLATRAREYGPLAHGAVVPLAVAAVAAFRLPSASDPAAYAQWGRFALGCAVAALVWIVVALRIASTG